VNPLAEPSSGEKLVASCGYVPRPERLAPRDVPPVACCPGLSVETGRRGFTLIEVMIAASLMLLTAVCVTPLLVGGQQASARESRAGEARRLAQSTLEMLRGLPFAPPAPQATATTTDRAASVVGSVYPHADVARNRADAFVVLANSWPWSSGTFVTRHRVGVFEVTTGSRFGIATPDGFAPLSNTRLVGYDSSIDGELPSGVLFVAVHVAWAERGRGRSVTRCGTLHDDSAVATGAAALSP
jgi:prepilin-type N-terminal cleavage/methylation domain-containing protein